MKFPGKKEVLTTVNERFLEACREVCADHNIKENELTKLLRLSSSYISRLKSSEQTRTNVTIYQLYKLNKRYGYSLNWLVLGEGAKKEVKINGELERRLFNIETALVKLEAAH